MNGGGRDLGHALSIASRKLARRCALTGKPTHRIFGAATWRYPLSRARPDTWRQPFGHLS
jgi:hypothetical protein